MIDPIRYYEVKGNNSSKLLTAYDASGTAGTKVLTPAVSGYIYRVMGYKAQGLHATVLGTYEFRSGGGTILQAYDYAPLSAANGQQHFIMNHETGLFESVVSEGISVLTATQPVNVTIYYILYKPA